MEVTNEGFLTLITLHQALANIESGVCTTERLSYIPNIQGLLPSVDSVVFNEL